MVKFEDVPEALRLNYYMGAIVINDSFTEHEARVLWSDLQPFGLVTGKRPEMFGRLLPKLLEAFANPAVPEELRGIGVELIQTTQKWHDYRRRLVHDLLVMGWGRGDDVHSAIRKNPPRPMADLVECADALQACGHRLRGFYIIAPHWLGSEGDGWESADDLRSWTRVAMGHIADVPSVIVGTEGPSPEPPGGWDAIVAAAVAKREAEEAKEDAFQFVFEPDDED